MGRPLSRACPLIRSINVCLDSQKKNCIDINHPYIGHDQRFIVLKTSLCEIDVWRLKGNRHKPDLKIRFWCVYIP